MTEELLSTAVYRTFADAERKFELRLGEMKELEQVLGAGIGAVYTRVATLQFKAEDIRQTIRLGLIGGGMVPAEAAATILFAVDGREFNTTHMLALDILRAAFEGVDTQGNFGGSKPSHGGQATSAPSTNTAPRQASTPEQSIQ